MTAMLCSGQWSTLQHLFSRNVNLETCKNTNLSYQMSISLQQSPKHVSLVQGKTTIVSNTLITSTTQQSPLPHIMTVMLRSGQETLRCGQLAIQLGKVLNLQIL